MKLSNRISLYAFQVRYAAAPTPEDREIYQKEWQTYKKQHPDTNKDEQEYIADRLREREGKPKQKKEDNDSYSPLHAEVEEMDDEPTEVEVEEYESEIAPRVEVEEIPDDDADGEDIPSTEVKPKSKPHPLDHPDDAQTLSDLDVAPDVDKDKLHKALSKILDDRDKDDDDLTDKFRSAVDKIVDVVDFDSYVKSLPSEAKQLADHLKKKQEKAEEHASKVISSGGSYADYKKLKLPAHAVSWKRFKELQEKAEKAAQEAQEEAKGKGVEVKEKGKKPKKDKSPKTETPKTETPNTVPALFNDLFEDKGDSTGDSDSDTKVEAPKAPEPDKKKKVVVEDTRLAPPKVKKPRVKKEPYKYVSVKDRTKKP